MVNDFPYLPEIIKEIAVEVNNKFSTRDEDAFTVNYGYGLQADVTKFLNKAELAGVSEDSLYPFIWLPMNIANQRGRRWDMYSDTTFDLIICCLTKQEYTMDEREQINLFPRLYPIYEEVLNQMILSAGLDVKSKEDIKHTEIWRPYWGGNEDGIGTKNLFKKEVDALHIKGIQVQVNNKKCTVFSSL